MAGQTPDPIDLDAALKGQSPTLAAKDAVYRLARAAPPDAAGQLDSLVREGTTLPIRQRAALGLSLGDDARRSLVALLTIDDEPRVLAAVLLSLARVARAEDLPAMRTAASRLTGREAAQAKFAELLVAHRLRLGTDVVAPIPTPAAGGPAARTKTIATGAPEERARAMTRVVLNANLGFDPDLARATPVQCGRRRILVIPAGEMASGTRRELLGQRAVIGATAAYEREPGTWFHDLWILSTPVAGGVELQAWTQGGRAAYVGSGRLENDVFTFTLNTTASSRLALVDVRGRLAGDALTIDGALGDRDPSESRAPVLRVRG